MIVAGNRLDAEIKEDFLAIMYQILDLEEAIVIAVIGECPGLQARVSENGRVDRIFFLGEQELSEDIQTVILRIPSPIGKGMNPNLYLSFLLRKCKKNETIELYGGGGKIRRKRTNG